MQREKFVVVFTVFVDVIGVGIVLPILPFYVESFGASPFVVTLLFSSFAFFAFLSSPFLGALSDKIGKRPVLIASIASTALGWFVFASATSIPLLFLGRIIDGAAAGNFTVAQSCLVDVARDEKERSSNLGIIGAMFGIGLMIGPFIGGVLSTVSHAFPFWIAGALASLNTILTYFLLPETHRRRDANAVISFNPLTPLARAAINVKLRPLFLTWILFALSFMSSQSVFALYAQHAFGFDSFVTGLLFAATGILGATNQTLLLKNFWYKYFSESNLEVVLLVVLAIAFVLMGTRVLTLFYVGGALLASAQAVLRVVITSQIAGNAEPHMKGEALGIITSLLAAMMVIGPVMAGALFELHDTIPFFISAVLMLIALWIAFSFRRSARIASAPASVSISPEQES